MYSYQALCNILAIQIMFHPFTTYARGGEGITQKRMTLYDGRGSVDSRVKFGLFGVRAKWIVS